MNQTSDTSRRCRVVVCRGCCCGTPARHPGTDHEAQLARLVALPAERATVSVSGCLGACDYGDIGVPDKMTKMTRMRPPRLNRPGMWAGTALAAIILAVLTGLFGMHGVGAPAAAGVHGCSVAPAASVQLAERQPHHVHRHAHTHERAGQEWSGEAAAPQGRPGSGGHRCHHDQVCEAGYVGRQDMPTGQLTTPVAIGSAGATAGCPFAANSAPDAAASPPPALTELAVLLRI